MTWNVYGEGDGTYIAWKSMWAVITEPPSAVMESVLAYIYHVFFFATSFMLSMNE